MNDISHQWGGDLEVGSSGDLAISSGSDVVRQRVLRRILTNPGDYIWNLGYGGGLGQFVGAPTNPAQIEAVITTQLTLESSVAATPAPTVDVRIADAANGYFVASVTYADQSSSSLVQLNVSIG